MKILIAIDSFKGSISSVQGSEAISKGIREVYPDAEILSLPLADGGEGTVEAMVYATGGMFVEKEVVGPLGKKLNAVYGITNNGKTAIIEVAAACGLPLLAEHELNPMKTTSYGVGELIVDAMEKGCRNFIIGLGGSATNDAGVGMLQAIGYRFLDENNKEVPVGGQGLSKINHIVTRNAHPLLKECTFQIACDVKNYLHGEDGAAYVFGPQKGATPEMVVELDNGLHNFASIVTRDLGIDVHHIEGTGAAGGLGAAFFGFLHGNMKSGVNLILDQIELESKLPGVNIVITGEGMLDGQTSMGKAPSGVAELASKKNIPVIALAGGIKQESVSLNENSSMTACFSIVNRPMLLEEAMDKDTTYDNLVFTTSQIFRLIKGIK
jgi:glycerate 2-kinase